MNNSPSLGRRICVIGTSGSGKTYVAEALAERLGIRYVCNDALIWRANWEEVPRAQRYAAFDQATRDGDWTFDGNLGPTPEDELVLARSDTLIWLDLSKWQIMWSITVRTLRRAITRERLWHGNVEPWLRVFTRDSMVLWSWRSYPRRKQAYAALFADPAYAGRARIRLTSRGDVNRWLEALPRR